MSRRQNCYNILYYIIIVEEGWTGREDHRRETGGKHATSVHKRRKETDEDKKK